MPKFVEVRERSLHLATKTSPDLSGKDCGHLSNKNYETQTTV